MFNPSIYLCFAFFVLTSCSAYSVRSGKELAAKNPVAISPDLALPMERAKPLEFEITENSPVYATDKGNSYFSLVRLPKDFAPGKVVVKSFCDCFGFSKAVFLPIAEFLDKNFRFLKPIEFSAVSPVLTEPAKFSGEAPLAPEYAYILIYSNPKIFGLSPGNVTVGQTQTSRKYIHKDDKIIEETTYKYREFGLWWEAVPFGEFEIEIQSN